MKVAIFATFFTAALLTIHPLFAENLNSNLHSTMQKKITTRYSAQLTDPQKKNRKSFSQFGYNLSYTAIPVFPIRQFITPGKFGTQSYSVPSSHERNGSLYTCKGGFIDFSHMRAALDWTVYVAFTLITKEDSFELPPESGVQKIEISKFTELNIADITDLAQRIAFERLVWHEIASWHYHKPNHFFSEQSSAFSPEDFYSNTLGTLIGKRVALRLLSEEGNASYETVATQEIERAIAELHPVASKKATMRAYDIVDRHVQNKLPAAERNDDIWWDSKILFVDQRFLFKRNTTVSSQMKPWLVPQAEKIGCDQEKEFAIEVPELNHDGNPLQNYYRFTITPSDTLFYSKKNHQLLHAPFSEFDSTQIKEVIQHLKPQIEQVLGAGFDERDHHDPVPSYTHVKRILFSKQ